MQVEHSALQLSASDLGRFLSCRHCTALDVEVAAGTRAAPFFADPFLEMLAKRGLEHEKKYLTSINDSSDKVLNLAGLSHAEAEDRCLEAMQTGRRAIAQGVLRSRELLGVPDVLQRVETPSGLGSWSYEVYDTKLARETRGTTILQLSLYSELLGETQGLLPDSFHVITPNPLKPRQSFRVADYAAFYRFVLRGLKEMVGQESSKLLDANYPEPVDYCDVCRWGGQCDKRRRKDDHLSLVAGMTRLQRRELEPRGIITLAALGRLPVPLAFKPQRGSKESIERVCNQARVQLEEREIGKPVRELLEPIEAGRGLATLPLPSIGDVFLDLEGDHFAREGGREYLFGLTILEAGGRTRHVKLWGHSDTEEKAAFEKTVDEILTSWAAHHQMHVYHYAPYEPSAFKRLMGRHVTRGTDIDKMLRSRLFVDLYAVVRQGLRASVEKYSIKDLEKFYGFERQAKLFDAGAARRFIEQALEAEDPESIPAEIRTLVENYNEEDCVSALWLRDWLESLRKELEEGGTAVPRPLPGDGEISEKAEERNAEVQAAMDALLAGVPAEKNERSREEHAKWLLAHMLEFHRREDKVTWWEFFRLSDLVEEDDLLDERAAVAGLVFVQRLPLKGREKTPVDRYTFPPQEFEADKKDKLYVHGGTMLGTVVAFDAASRSVDVKKTIASAQNHPRSAFIHSRFPPDTMETALMRLASQVIASGLDSVASAARDLLLGNAPRLKSGTHARKDGEDRVEWAKRTVLDLDRSILPIQGPPGAGKTYTGARMILDCVRNGLKVGVTAVSHKVIENLLRATRKAAADAGVPWTSIRKVSDLSEVPEPGIDETTDAAEVRAALDAGRAQVGAGTAWLWAHVDFADFLDVLFVDEAGQASLANVLAMAQSAKSVVLLGDPQQLQQPQRGTHPDGVDASALQHLLGDEKTIPDEKGIFLEETWRLAPSICRFTSDLFYEDRLKPRPGLDRLSLSGVPPYEGTGLWFAPVEHDGNRDVSPEEVAAVEAIVGRLLAEGSVWTNEKGETKPLGARDILVVAPFNRHVNRLQEAIRSRGVSVGTVDKFQGQEAAVVIYSMATSRPEDAPRGMEFLYSLDRFNVATSRARCACILVASPRLLEPDCKTPRQMRLTNALCRYAELAHVVYL